MPYGERMLFLIGAGVMLIGAGWFLLVRWPSIEQAASTPAAVSVEDASTAVEDTVPGLAEETPAEPEVTPRTDEPVPGEGSLNTIQNEAPSVPENVVPEEEALPEPVELEEEVTATGGEVEVFEDERHSEAVVEYPLPAESIRPAESERDAPIQMVITRDRPVSSADETVAAPQADTAVSE